MKKNKQKILCLFLSFCMIISCMVGISVTASADTKTAKIVTTIDDYSATVVESTTLPQDFSIKTIISLFAWNTSTVNSITVTGATIKSGTNENIVVTISDYGSFTVDINYNSEYQNNLNANYSVSITEADTPTHTHIWSYAADGATITANCGEGCDITTAPKITVVAPLLSMEGGTESAEATLSKSTTWSTEIGIVDDPAISYYQTETANATTGGEALLAAPTTAGNYYAQITVENEGADDAVAAVAYVIEPAPLAVSEITLQQSSNAVHIGDSVMLTATVIPEDAADTTVMWSVTNDDVKLYSDPDCTVEVGADATDTLTVYAKSTSPVTATVYVTSNSDEEIDASRTVRFSYDVTFSGGGNAVMKAVTDEGDEYRNNLLNTPEGIGAFLRDFSVFITLVYEADDGYVFEPFEPIVQNGVTVTWTDEATLTITGNPTADVEIELPDAFEPNNKIDISEGDVTVNVAAQSVSVTVDGEPVPAGEYHVIFFTYEEIEGGESLTRVGNEFPTEEGTYIAAVCANEDSELYTGENRSDPFIIEAPEPEPEPEPESKSRNDIAIGTYSRPVYHTNSNTTMLDTSKISGAPATEEKHSTGEDATKAYGKFEDITDEEENAGDAELSGSDSDIADAILDESDREAMANGENVKVYIEVEKIEPTEEEERLIEEALAALGDDAAAAMILDMNLFKKVGGNEAEQIHETNGKIKVVIDLPEGLENFDPNVERTFYIIRIHDGEIEIIPATYDPETGKLTFFTDRFSMYVLCYVDVDLPEPVDSDDDDEVEIDGGIIGPTEKPAQEADVQGAGETNPHTGAALPDLAVLVLSAAAAAVTFRKRQK